MATTARCPCCNQPLGSDVAVRHLHRAEEQIRRRIVAEADKKLAEVRGSVEKEVRTRLTREQSRRERALGRETAKLHRQEPRPSAAPRDADRA
jgi:hypothetical protein